MELTDGSSSGIAAIYLSFMETVADKFSHSWTAAPQLPLTHKLDWHRGLMNKDVIKDLFLHPQSFPTTSEGFTPGTKKRTANRSTRPLQAKQTLPKHCGVEDERGQQRTFLEGPGNSKICEEEI